MAQLSDHARPVAATFKIRDREPILELWRDRLGLEIGEDDPLQLAPRGDGFTLTFVEDPDATPRPYPCVGLYHLALLLPDRASLAAIVQRLRQSGLAFEGFADHAVSEAVYLRDAEQTGIELYRDRPRDDWPRDDDQIQMTTDPLDVGSLLDAAKAPQRLAPDTLIGHVHLHVPGLDAAARFWGEAVGMDVTQRSYPGALFFSVGGYHHHVATNTWAPTSAPDDAAGLEQVTWRVAESDLEGLEERLEAEGFAPEVGDGWVAAVGPSGVESRFRASDS